MSSIINGLVPLSIIHISMPQSDSISQPSIPEKSKNATTTPKKTDASNIVYMLIDVNLHCNQHDYIVAFKSFMRMEGFLRVVIIARDTRPGLFVSLTGS